MWLLRYSGKNTEGYKLVYAATEEEAIAKLRESYFFIDQLHVESATIK